MNTPQPRTRRSLTCPRLLQSPLVLLACLSGCFDLNGVPEQVDGDPGEDAQIPDVTRQCMADADCSAPPSICQTAEGATCVDGNCSYPELRCSTPPASRCIDNGNTLVRSMADGACSADAGGCVYEEESIAVDPANCEELARECETVECPDTDCAIEGSIDPQSLACQCTYQTFLSDTQECEDINTLCSARSTCDGEGGCDNRSEILPAGERCLFFGEPVEALDEAGLPRALEPDEVRELVPVPFCEGPSGRCIECTVEEAQVQCNDGKPCTQDLCNEGLCQNLSEPQDDAECTLPGGGLFGSAGFCARGTCLQCDSTITDVAVRDEACVRLDQNGDVNACLGGATCVNNQCQYDLFNDPALEASCIEGDGSMGFCLLGTCVECTDVAQCPDDADECIVRVCNDNTCGFENAPNDTICVIESIEFNCRDGFCDGS